MRVIGFPPCDAPGNGKRAILGRDMREWGYAGQVRISSLRLAVMFHRAETAISATTCNGSRNFGMN